MNRLILVGNGFDLAHGLKTSYKDFIIWYLANCFYKTDRYQFFYEDNLIAIRIYNILYFKDFVRRNVKASSNFLLQEEEIRQLFHLAYEKGELCEFLDIHDRGSSDFMLVSDGQNVVSRKDADPLFEMIIESDFLKSLIITCQDCDWVDVENEYFNYLKTCKTKDNLFDKEKVQQLNSQFAYLKQKLEEYLTLQQENATIKVIPKLLDAIKLDFNISDFDSMMSYEEARIKLGFDKTKSAITNDLYFLNFNYTNTLLSYEGELEKNRGNFNKVETIHIHGELRKSNNPIIFGFGDEHNKQYLEFEEYSNNKLFEHIKSYQYLRTSNYRKLLRFLNGDEYQVFVMGHSCGLSDRTMFKEIFEHENCKSIRLFHYNGDFHDKVINISKHFSNKGHMRKLIVDYRAKDAFPQSAEI